MDTPEHDEDETYSCDYPFVVFRANSFEDAFEQALRLGREQETTYKNSKGEDVRWALNAVEQIYELGEDLDGIEVGSLMDSFRPDQPLEITSDLDPASKQPLFGSNAKETTEAEQDGESDG